MEAFLKIESIGLDKLNNAEYANFCNRTKSLMQNAGIDKVGITMEEFTAWDANIAKMTDIVAQSRISDLTETIAETDKECDHLISYIFAMIDAAVKSPIAVENQAAKHLVNVVKPYRGIQRMAQGQQIQQTKGMLMDLGKDANFAATETLNMGLAIQELRKANNRYMAQIEERAQGQIDSALPAAKAVRQEMNAQYDYITTRAFITSVATPSDEATTFVKAMNKLIADTNHAYNQRMAQIKREEEEAIDN
ncbi:DUF6261 family protein [Bacteroides sp. OttesenSCG-928-D19]|nr:DUF6261 family protein [Bacteroides sp. OttesenSCG-928-D19]